MPKDLYEQVKDEIPKYIGVYIGDWRIKKAKKQQLTVDEQVLKDSLIRSLCREVEKQIRSGNPTIVESLERQLRRAKTEVETFKRKYWELMDKGIAKFG